MTTEQANYNRCQTTASPSPALAGSTQGHTSFKTQLLHHGISDDKAEELKDRFNRRSIPVMDDELFFKHLHRIATTTVPEGVERELERFVCEEGARIHEDCLTAKFKIGGTNMDGLQMNSLHIRLILSLRTHTIHGFEGLVAYLLPTLIEELLRRAQPPKCRHRISQGQGCTHKVLQPQTTGGVPRRSARISQRRRTTRLGTCKGPQ